MLQFMRLLYNHPKIGLTVTPSPTIGPQKGVEVYRKKVLKSSTQELRCYNF